MKNPRLTVVIAFIAGLSGVWLGGIFIPLVMDGQIFKADILGSLGTWLGSICTAGTLIFVIRQNIELRESQKETDQKQQEMWDAQREIIAFQKLQAHKQQFNTMLDELERNYPIEFFDRTSLYKNIFPNNDFESCHTKVSLIKDTSKVVAGDLSDIRDATNFLRKSLDEFNRLNASTYYRHTHNHLGQVSSILSLLHVAINTPKDTGDVFISIGAGYYLLNVFDPSSSLRIIEKIVNRLMEFTGNDDNYQAIISHMCTSYYLDALRKFGFQERNQRGYSVFKKNGGEKYVDNLIKCQQITARPEVRGHHSLNAIYCKLSLLFAEKTEVISLLESRENLCELFREILHGVAEYCDDGERSEEFHRLRNDIRAIVNELKRDMTGSALAYVTKNA